MSRTDRVLIGVLVACVGVWGTTEALPAAAWLAVVSVLLGGAITGVFSWYYYQRASEELRREAERIRHYLHMALRVLQAQSGGHKFTIRYDEQGEPVWVDYHTATSDQIGLKDHVEPMLSRPDAEDA